ncbi:MAG: hypothetical protein KY453_03675 [Gemmatimonadetes bacterium]|nr:hypothetical protein [Gemmatimonadota bacterium]
MRGRLERFHPRRGAGKYLAVWRETDEGWKLSAVAATNDTPLSADASGEEPSG